MAPRGHEGYDVTPILTHYLFLFTSILAIAGWFTAFIGQAVETAQRGHGNVGVLWFAIFEQLFLILGVLHTLASDSIATNRIQISIFGAVSIVFAVFGVNQGIFSPFAASNAFAAGWLILAVVNILWTLYFTSEEDSLTWYILNSLGTGGLTPPNRRRRTRGQSVHMGGGTNGYASGGYGSGGIGGGGIGPNDMPYDKQIGIGGTRSQASLGRPGSIGGAPARSIGAASGTAAPGSTGADNIGVSSPLMGSGNAGIGAGGGASSPERTGDMSAGSEGFVYKAKALYAYTASPDDPNEISFIKGEVLDIIDKQGKWWQARKPDGSTGIAPSNYLQLI